MLQKLNERIQGVFAWVIILLIAGAFALFGVEYYFQSKQGNNDIQIRVNGEPISKSVFDATYRRLRQQQPAGNLTTGREAELNKQVLDRLILQKVSAQTAIKNGFYVSSEQANSAILTIPQFIEEGHFSNQRYQQALSAAFYTPQIFQHDIQQGMLLNQQRFAFIGSAIVLPQELDRFIALYNQTRSYRYLSIKPANFIDANQIAENKIKQYYEAHKQDFKSQERVSLEYIKLSADKLKNQAQVSTSEVRKYFDENAANFTLPAKWHIENITFAIPKNANEATIKKIKQKATAEYERIKQDPDLFSEIAKQYSADKLSVKGKDSAYWVTAGTSDLDSKLVALTQKRAISEPTRTSRGYEIYKLLDYKAPAIRPFKQVEDKIRKQLSEEKMQQLFSGQLEELTELSYQNPDSLQPVADKLDLKLLHTEPFERSKGAGLAQNQQIRNVAFSSEVLQGSNSDPIQLDDDSVVVIRLKKHYPPTLQPLHAVKADIKSILVKDAAIAKAHSVGNLIVNKLHANLPIKSLLEKNNLQWSFVKSAGRENASVSPLINEFAFTAPVSKAQGKSLSDGEYIVVLVSSIQDGSLSSLDKEQKAGFRQQMETTLGLIEYDLYIEEAMKQAVVK